MTCCASQHAVVRPIDRPTFFVVARIGVDVVTRRRDNLGSGEAGNLPITSTHNLGVRMNASSIKQDTTPASVPTSVYRYYDAKGTLIYVGVTSSRTARNQQHNSDKAWWPFVKSQTIEHHPSRTSALNRERALIQQFLPPFNKQHNPHHDETLAQYMTMARNVSGVVVGRASTAVNRRSLDLRMIAFQPQRRYIEWETGAGVSVVTQVMFYPARRPAVMHRSVPCGHVYSVEKRHNGALRVSAFLRDGHQSVVALPAVAKLKLHGTTMEIRRIDVAGKP